MLSRHRALLFVAAALACLPQTASRAEDEVKPIAIAEVKRDKPVDFETEILPLLSRSCTACHSTTVDESGLVLESPETIKKGGDRGPAVVAGKSAESLLLKVAARLEEPHMPPPDNDVEAPALKPEDLGLIKLWIDQGATGEVTGRANVSWQPLPPGVNPIYAVALSSDGQIAACGRANQIFIYHVPTGELITRLSDPSLVDGSLYSKPGVAHLDLVQSLAFDPAGDLLASSGYKEVKIWRRPRDVRRCNLAAAGAAVQAVATSPDNKWLATGSADNSIKLFNLNDGKPGATLSGHSGPVTSLRFTPDGSKLVSGSMDKSIRVWSTADGKPAGQIDTPSEVLSLTLVAGGAQVASGGNDNLIRLWDLPAGASPALAQNAGTTLAASPDRKQLAVGMADGKINLIEAATGKAIKTLSGHSGAITALSFAQANVLASAAADKTVRVWDVAKGEATSVLRGGPADVAAVALNPKTAEVSSGDAKNLVSVYKLDVAAPRALEGDNGAAAVVTVLSPDGKKIATAATAEGKPAILVSDFASGKVTQTLVGHEAPITALAFSADNNRLVSGSADKTARVWNLADGKELAKYAGHAQPVTAVAISPNGQQAASASENSAKLWNTADGAEAMQLQG